MSNDLTVQKDALGVRSSALRRRMWLRTGLLALCVIALLAFTLHSLRLSDASFAAASANPTNVFVSGTLAHVNDQNGQVVVTASDMEPGATADGTMTLTGAGTLVGDYTLTPASLTDVPASPALSGTLTLTIEDTTGAVDTLYDGTVADFDFAELGSIAPGASRSYRIALEYPDGPNDGSLQGAAMTLVLQVTEVSQ
jgi:hypothetical protein